MIRQVVYSSTPALPLPGMLPLLVLIYTFIFIRFKEFVFAFFDGKKQNSDNVCQEQNDKLPFHEI